MYTAHIHYVGMCQCQSGSTGYYYWCTTQYQSVLVNSGLSFFPRFPVQGFNCGTTTHGTQVEQRGRHAVGTIVSVFGSSLPAVIFIQSSLGWNHTRSILGLVYYLPVVAVLLVPTLDSQPVESTLSRGSRSSSIISHSCLQTRSDSLNRDSNCSTVVVIIIIPVVQ